MNNKKFLVFLLMAFILVGTLSQVSAFMPRYTHKYIHQEALKDPVNSEIYKSCMKYPSLCYSGNVLADISVIFYWTQGYKYEVTHNPNFCRALIEESQNDQEDACAIGGCMHQPADIVSHNTMVEKAIRTTGLANYIVHVFAEQKVDNWVERTYPGVGDEALNYLSDYETCTPLFKRVMLGNEEYSDITSEQMDTYFDKFIVEIMTSQTGYDSAFKQKSFLVNIKSLPFIVLAGYSLVMFFFMLITILLFIKIFRKQATLRHYIALIIFLPIFIALAYVFIANLNGSAFNAVINVAKPISGIIPLGDTPKFYTEKAIQNTKDFLQQGPSWLTDTDASGFKALEEADHGVIFFDYLLLIALISFFVWYVWFLFKRNKIKISQTFTSSYNNL